MFLVPVNRRSSELSRLFDDTFDQFFNAATPSTEAFSPALDVTESPQSWTVKLDLPGVSKEDVKIAIDGRQISVEAQVRKDDERKEGDRVVYRERTVSRFARSFTLPADVDQTESAAKLDSGVLTLTLSKKRASQASQIAVN